MRQKLRLGPSFRFFESLCSKDSFFSSFFSFTCNHSKIHVYENNSSLVTCIHMTFTFPHKFYFTCMVFTLNYGVPHKFTLVAWSPLVVSTDPRPNRESRQNRSKVVLNNSTTPLRLSSSVVYVSADNSA